jgi:hypothetical protein
VPLCVARARSLRLSCLHAASPPPPCVHACCPPCASGPRVGTVVCVASCTLVVCVAVQAPRCRSAPDDSECDMTCKSGAAVAEPGVTQPMTLQIKPRWSAMDRGSCVLQVK